MDTTKIHRADDRLETLELRLQQPGNDRWMDNEAGYSDKHSNLRQRSRRIQNGVGGRRRGGGEVWLERILTSDTKSDSEPNGRTEELADN